MDFNAGLCKCVTKFSIRWCYRTNDINHDVECDERFRGAFEALRNSLGTLEELKIIIRFKGPECSLNWEMGEQHGLQAAVELIKTWEGIKELNIELDQKLDQELGQELDQELKIWREEKLRKRLSAVEEIKRRVKAKTMDHQDESTLATWCSLRRYDATYDRTELDSHWFPAVACAGRCRSDDRWCMQDETPEFQTQMQDTLPERYKPNAHARSNNGETLCIGFPSPDARN